MDPVKFVDVYENWVSLLYPNMPPEFLNKYTCSNLGRFKNYNGRYINPYLSSGYYYVKLHAGDGKSVCFKRGAHQFIAYNFIPNPNNYPQVGHIDGNTSHNWADNLEWTTQSNNNLMRTMPEHYQTYFDKITEYISRLGETMHYDFGWKEWWRFPGYYGNPLGLIKYPDGTITPGNLTFGHSYYEIRLGTTCKPTHIILVEIFCGVDILYNTDHYFGTSIDHINSNPLDNRICNLRICDSHKDNMNNPNTQQKIKNNRYGSSKI